MLSCMHKTWKTNRSVTECYLFIHNKIKIESLIYRNTKDYRYILNNDIISNK